MRKKWLAFVMAGALAVSSLSVANAEGLEQPEDAQENVSDMDAESPSDSENALLSDMSESSLKDRQSDEEEFTPESSTEIMIQGENGDQEEVPEQTEETAGRPFQIQADTQDGAEDTADAAEDRVYIPDETLRQALQGENYNVDIDEDGYAAREDMEEIMSFDIRGGEGLADLTGLEAAVNLNWLTLEECGITSEFMEKNADVLSALPKLYTLYLWNNAITDISFLESIPQVKDINLINNEITDFAP